MMVHTARVSGLLLIAALSACTGGMVSSGKSMAYQRIKAHLDSTPAIDTHDHLPPFDRLPGYVETDQGRGMNLAGLWKNSYLNWFHPITPWRARGAFDEWWAKARHDFDDVRTASTYRYQLPAFQDLYGVDFDRITDPQAHDLNGRIFRNYRDQKWLYRVITERANIELMLNDPWWGPLDFRTAYSFEVLVLRVSTLIRGFHPSEYSATADDPYHFARQRRMRLESLDDYLGILDSIFSEAREKGVVCIKTTSAYQRPLRFENVPKERAARAFGRPRSGLTPQEIQDFEDFITWRLAELSAKYELPFQIHTGWGHMPGSNPILLANLIEGNPKTRFVLLHGGFPWVGEALMVALKFPKRVWIDSVWLPTLNQSMAKRAFHEWLDSIPSSQILWGADCNHPEGIYGATETTRRCLAEVLAEKVESGVLLENRALRIGRQILRENALALFPRLEARLWKQKSGRLEPPGGDLAH